MLALVYYVGKYDRANDRPKFAMLAIDIGPMIDRGFNDDCELILACYIGPKIRQTFKFRMILTMPIKF